MAIVTGNRVKRIVFKDIAYHHNLKGVKLYNAIQYSMSTLYVIVKSGENYPKTKLVIYKKL